MNRFKSALQMLGVGGLGMLGASLISGPASATALDPAGMASTMGGVGGVEGMGGAALVGVLVWLLQGSTRERVAEAKEYGEGQRESARQHAAEQQAMHANHQALIMGQLESERHRADQLMQMLRERSAPPAR